MSRLYLTWGPRVRSIVRTDEVPNSFAPQGFELELEGHGSKSQNRVLPFFAKLQHKKHTAA